MDSNATDSGNRVTRSLRKRLTSVDSENSSRPSTPISAKLTAISEISSSPSRSTRMTRRNSISGLATPVKTPAKRGVGTLAILENFENSTPTRRSSRRCNASVHENEENSQTGPIISTFAPLDEEIEECFEKTIKITCSQSKSPQNVKILKATPSPKKAKSPKKNEKKEVQSMKEDFPKKRKIGPKSKTREREEDFSDVEVNSFIDLENKSSNITIILTDADSSEEDYKCMEENGNQKDNEKSKKTAFNVINNDKKATSTINDVQLNHAEQIDTLKNDTTSNIEILEETIDENVQQKKSEKLTTSCQPKEIYNVEEQNLDISTGDKQENINVQDSVDIKNELHCEEHSLEDNKIRLSFSEDINGNTNDIHRIKVNDYTTPEAKEKPFLYDTAKITNVSNLTPYRGDGVQTNSVCVVSLKKVKFVSSPNDMSIKHVYPKTPASMNSENSSKQIKPSRNDDSFQDKDNSVNDSFQDKVNSIEIGLDNHQNDIFITEESKIEMNKDGKTQIMKKNITPKHGLKCSGTLNAVESLVSINMEASAPGYVLPIAEKHGDESDEKPLIELAKIQCEKDMKTADVAKSLINKILNNTEDHSPNRCEKTLKWINPCVKGTTENGSKLDDVVITQNNTNISDCCDNTNYVGKKLENNKKNMFSSERDEEAEEEDFNDFALEEEVYERQHDFQDDEALEVENYESGDSMDSEEQREIEENEIPIYADSIGSHTTEDDQNELVEEEHSDNAESFIASDNEEANLPESDIEELKIDEDMNGLGSQKKKKIFKRLLHPEESSSSDEGEVDPQVNGNQNIEKNLNILEKQEIHNERSIYQPGKEENDQVQIKLVANSCESVSETKNMQSKSSENVILDSSKLSDSALRLHCSAESEFGEEKEDNSEKIILSRKKVICNLNRSDLLNNSVCDLNSELEASLTEKQCIAKRSSKIIQENNEMHFDVERTVSTSLEECANKMCNINQMQCEGEISMASEIDADSENGCKSLYLSQHKKTDNESRISFDSCNKSKEEHTWHRSFGTDISVKREEQETADSDIKLKESVSNFSSHNDDQSNEKLKSEDVNYQKNVRHIPLPLGNPLIRTRRQSLALPTNPDMEICSSSHASGIGKRANRKSFGAFSNIDFNPSQSFIDSIELQKNENKQLLEKRKRLSKSFCGASEGRDNSIVDIDVRHLHKRSKLMSENSIAGSYDSIENINSGKIFTKTSSTPHEKINKDDSYNNRRILRRCDEILEAANLAKLKYKIHNKKNNVKTSKKLSKKKSVLTASDEANSDNVLRRISKERNRKDKTKTALLQAIKAADVIITQKKKTYPKMKEEDKLEPKRLGPDVLEALGELIAIKKNCKEEKLHNQQQMRNAHTSSTSAGNIRELPQSPEKRRKTPTYIQLPTGKVSVEPVTPKKRIIQALNGMEFKESPITPSTSGFKVCQILPPENNVLSSGHSIERKRKRCRNESLKHCTSTKSQWTKSGFFIEENVAKRSQISHSGPQKIKKHRPEREEHHTNRNFKENAMMRPDIRRSSKREISLLKERRKVQELY